MSTRILYVESGLGMGGATRCLHDIARGALERGYEPFVAIAYEDPELASLVDHDHLLDISPFRRIGVDSHPGGTTGPVASRVGQKLTGSARNLVNRIAKDAPLTRFLLGEIKRLGIDLVHTNNGLLVNRAAIEAAHRAGAAVITHQRGWEWPCVLARCVARKTGRIIAISEAVKQDLIKLGVSAGRITRIYDGVDVARFDVRPETRSAARQEFGVDEGAMIVGFIASHLAWKGHEVYLRALANVARANDGVRGLVVGSRPVHAENLHPSAKEIAHDLRVADRIVWLEQMADPAPAYAACDIVVHASTQPEPLGLVVLEAMSSGVPVVASLAGGTAETVVDGKTGLLYAMGDAEALSACLKKLIINPTLRREMGSAARHRAVRQFALESCQQRLFDVYGEWIGSGRPAAPDEERCRCEPLHS